MRNGRRAATLGALLLALLSGPWWTSAQQPPGKQELPGELTAEEKFWFDTPTRRAATAAQMVLARNPAVAALVRLKGKEDLVWGLELDVETFPAIEEEWLDEIRDGRPMPDFRGKGPGEVPKADIAMYQAFNQALVLAYEQPLGGFRKAAKENEHLKFAHLWNEPRVHRGKVIVIQGWMARLRKFDPAPKLALKKGVKHAYEGWVFGETKGAYPYACIFPVLPEGLEVSERMNRKVTMVGYFLGHILVRIAEKDIKTPLIVGPTVIPERAENPTEETPFSFVILVGVVGLVLGITAIIFSLSWWFRKGDEAIQARLATRQQQQVLDSLQNEESVPLALPLNIPPQTGITAEPPKETPPNPPNGS